MKTLWYLIDDGKKSASTSCPSGWSFKSCTHKIYTWRRHVTVLDVFNKCSIP